MPGKCHASRTHRARHHRGDRLPALEYLHHRVKPDRRAVSAVRVDDLERDLADPTYALTPGLVLQCPFPEAPLVTLIRALTAARRGR